MGRDKDNENRGRHFAMMERSLMETAAWRALRRVAQALYPWLKLEWAGPKANNNGHLKMSLRDAAKKMGVKNHNTLGPAFHDLQAKGFIVVTKPARLGVGGEAASPEFEITEIEMPNCTKRGGRRLYSEWKPGADYQVQKATANNPKGSNRKTKSHHKFQDSTVIKNRTWK